MTIIKCMFVLTNAVLQQKKLAELREQHDDLLELLAQQEIEIQVFSNRLLSAAGAIACADAGKEVERLANEKYGSYISFRTRTPDMTVQEHSIARLGLL